MGLKVRTDAGEIWNHGSMPLARLIFEAAEPPANWLGAWSFPVAPFVGLAVLLALYLRGWAVARRTRWHELPVWRAACFVGGVLSLWIAIASPIDALDDYLLAAHMIQHFILMSIAPPLLVLGAPTVPMLRGLPRLLIRFPAAPLLRARWFRATIWFVTHPVSAWLAMNIAYLGWHVPVLFELTFRSERVHQFEHLCFLLTSIAFWWVVLAPWPSHRRWPRWSMIPYLLTADVMNTILSATLAFSGKVLYPSYAEAPRISTLSPLKDQVAAGAEMWVLNSIVFLIPAVVLTMKMLSPKALRAEGAESRARIAS
jgi:cytochrome c oxidase assembly factor CtaG